MRSAKYSKVRMYYNVGVWTKGQVAAAVQHNWITAEEYKLIVGEDYVG